jgi:hypothetical protein
MSTYYDYYLGARERSTGKFSIIGPYDNKGGLRSICTLCGLSDSEAEFNSSFYILSTLDMEEEMKKKLWGDVVTNPDWGTENWDPSGDPDAKKVSYLPFSELPIGSYYKAGYYPESEVIFYQKNQKMYDVDLFSSMLTPEVYAEKMKNELIFGKKESELDCEGNPVSTLNASDYIYAVLPDRHCGEYIANCMRFMSDVLAWDIDCGEYELVVIAVRS